MHLLRLEYKKNKNKNKLKNLIISIRTVRLKPLKLYLKSAFAQLGLALEQYLSLSFQLGL